ncbi:anti-phage defense ZorAB system ZorA [Candidatus Symbiopectobacterium sp. NZEC127]|uniref:anti-phage ZorAB system protein ZorA n=1 Tax=Candidatus Symbiopectobacterium sp. NZEC127 TaxID=2820472 RepID=UPI002227AEB9|nr:anti-phage ZorAB system protein ZorA [Candidatus Symbiopectobacterium sp. NZEC127]MCW2486529.1 anti-phage defense ZorAB system ZorA [Candidatus Symbiopectobacterium sp. NZEC127]
MIEEFMVKFGIWAIEGLRLIASYIPYILGVLTLPFIFFFLRGVWYWVHLGSVLKKLRTVNAKASLDTIQDIFPSKRLRHLWKQYRETLHAQHEDQDGQRHVSAIRSTIPAETFFNNQCVVDSYLGVEFFKHLPGIFTGLGIIGTFGGIIEGLGQFQVSEDAVAVRQSLESLMHSVGHAFLISGCAIALAMIFTILEKFLVASLYRKTEDISNTIDSHFEAGAGEEYLSRLVDASEASASQAKILKDALVSDLKNVLRELTQSQIEAGKALHDQQLMAARESNQSLGGVISTSIEKSLKAPLDEIAASVKSASGDQSKAAIDMLNDVMVHFSQRLNDLFGGQINGINELNKQTAQSMQDAVTSLNILLGKLEDSGKRATDEMAAKMASSIQAMEERQASINAQTQEFVDQIRRLVESSQSQTQQKLQGTLETIGQQMTTILRTLGESQAQVFAENRAREQAVSDRASSAVSQMSGSVEAAIQEISAATQAMTQSVAALSSATASSVDKMNAGAERLGTAASSFATAGERVTEVITQATTISDKLTEASGSLSAGSISLQEALRDYRAQREALAGLMKEVREMVDLARKEASITADALQRIEISTTKLGTAQKAADEYLDGVNQVLEQSSVSFREAVLSTLSKVNYDFHEKLGSAVGLLSTAVQELESSLGTIAAPNRR